MTRDYLSVKVWDLNMEGRPVETHQVHEYLRSKLCSLYENDCIFDKFECCWNGSDRWGCQRHRLASRSAGSFRISSKPLRLTATRKSISVNYRIRMGLYSPFISSWCVSEKTSRLSRPFLTASALWFIVVVECSVNDNIGEWKEGSRRSFISPGGLREVWKQPLGYSSPVHCSGICCLIAVWGIVHLLHILYRSQFSATERSLKSSQKKSFFRFCNQILLGYHFLEFLLRI